MTNFEWDESKSNANFKKHQVDFWVAQEAFMDPLRIIAEDSSHSKSEKRFFCFGKCRSGILTVRFTYRGGMIRIIGAGYWRKGKKTYEKINSL